MAASLSQLANQLTTFQSTDRFYVVRGTSSYYTTYADLLAAFGGGSVAWADITGTPTTLAGYGITDAQPLDSDLTAIAALTTTAFGRGLLTETNASTVRTTLGIDTNDAVTFGALTATSLVLTGALTGATSVNGLSISANTSTLSVYPNTSVIFGAAFTFAVADVAHTCTITTTGNTSVTLPTGGTILSTAGLGTGVNTALGIQVNTSGGPLTHGGAGAHSTLTASGAVTFTANTASTTTGTGTVVVTGGVGISGAVNIGGNFTGGGAITINSGGIQTRAGTFGYFGSNEFSINASVVMAMGEGANITTGTSTGTKICTATGQKLGFWNATPVVQQVLATGVGATVDNVISLLQTLGLCKQS